MANTVSTPLYPPSPTHLILINSQIAKHYTRLLRLWPTDALRPNLPFTTTITTRALPYGVSPPTDTSTPTKTPSNTSPTPSAAPVPATTASTHGAPANPALETAQITALYSLLEDRYSKKYPLSEAVFKPAGAPDHYEGLMREIERAPRKSWWGAKMDMWKMKIRWS
jgi:cytochrome b pre-mRNA-processing protein 6